MKVGKDVILSDNITIKRKENCSIGNHVAIDYGFYCTTKMEIGDYVHISPYVTCIGGKDGQFIAKGFNNIMAGVRIVCGSDRFDGSGLFGANSISWFNIKKRCISYCWKFVNWRYGRMGCL